MGSEMCIRDRLEEDEDTQSLQEQYLFSQCVSPTPDDALSLSSIGSSMYEDGYNRIHADIEDLARTCADVDLTWRNNAMDRNTLPGAPSRQGHASSHNRASGNSRYYKR